MPVSKTLGSFHDVKIVLDAALRAGGGVVTCENYGAAVRWRLRAYRLRTLLTKLSAEQVASFPGVAPSTPYDILVLKIDDAKRDGLVRIEIGRQSVELRTFDGELIPIESVSIVDELEEAAERVKKDLGFEL